LQQERLQIQKRVFLTFSFVVAAVVVQAEPLPAAAQLVAVAVLVESCRQPFTLMRTKRSQSEQVVQQTPQAHRQALTTPLDLCRSLQVATVKVSQLQQSITLWAVLVAVVGMSATQEKHLWPQASAVLLAGTARQMLMVVAVAAVQQQ
jgi:hypothetical protein